MTHRHIFAVLIIVLFSAPYAHAQVNPLKIETTAAFIPKSKIDSGSGDITIGKANIRIKKRFVLANALHLDAAIGGNHYIVDDKSSLRLPHSFKSRGLHLETVVPIDGADTFSLGIGLNPSFQTANTMNFDTDCFRMRSHAFLNIKSNEVLTVRLGATYRDDYEMSVIPYLGLSYQVTEQLAWLINSDEASISSRINYALTEASTIFTRANYELEEFIISEGTRKGTVIRYQDLMVGLGLEHRFNRHFAATVDAGGVFIRKIDYTNGTGKIAPEIAPYVGFDLKVSF